MSNIGSWNLISEAPTICAGTAAVAIKGRERTADFSIDYDWLVKEIKEKPKDNQYSMSKLSPVSLAVALNSNWEDLGKLRTITKTVWIGEDLKRYYPESPKNGEELLSKTYGSEPWDVSMLSNPTEEATRS